MKSRLGGFVNNANLMGSHAPVKWGIDKNPASRSYSRERRGLATWDMDSRIVGTSTDLEKMYLRLTTVRKTND